MPLMLEGIDDFVATTQEKFMRNSWTSLVHEFPDYIAPRLMAERGVPQDGGQSIKWLVQTGTAGNAQTTGLFRQVSTNVEDTMVQGSAPWRFQITSYGYDQREDFFQSDRETIVRMLKVRDTEARDDMVKLQEDLFWGAPTSSSDNDNLYGVTYWVQTDTTTDGDFLGGNPTAGSAGGIDSDTYSGWRNWTAGYDSPTTDDLVKKVKVAMNETDFRAPVPHPELGFGKADRCMYASYVDVIEPLERLAETRNQNLGSDLARYLGEVVIGRVPIKTSHWLKTNRTDDPVYGLDFGVFRPYYQRNLNMKRLPPEKVPGQPHGRRVLISHAGNYACVNRRRLFVISK